MKRLTFVLLLLVSAGALAQERGIVVVRDDKGNDVELYSRSHALLIGVSNYTAGWPDLEGIPGELDRVESALGAQGFQVERHADPDAQALEDAFTDFINAHGYESGNRLLFFFSGHGHTWQDRGRGYLVPSDAPVPASQAGDPGADFLRKALPMTRILAWTRELTAKHALFMFDSCFSGTIFKTRALPSHPSHITQATSLPVVQFITAGSAGETVPARSIFAPVLVDALNYGYADMTGDGYITGVELGLYLAEKVPQHGPQSPQFGKHPDYELARGDFVFALGAADGAVPPDGPVPPGPGARQPSADARVAVEKLAGQWLAAWLTGDVDTFVSLSSEPFYFDNKVVLSRAQLRSEYLALQAEKGEAWRSLVIDAIKVQTVRELAEGGYDISSDRIFKSLNLTVDDYAVSVFVGDEGLILMVRDMGGTFEIVGTWD